MGLVDDVLRTHPQWGTVMVAIGSRVLICEDHEQVRKIVSETLTADGYVVASASRPVEALELAASQGPFAMLVTDVVMPEMDGAELAHRLRLQLPGLRVLFVSGYGSGFVEDPELRIPYTAFLAKPFTPKDIIGAVERLLSSD